MPLVTVIARKGYSLLCPEGAITCYFIPKPVKQGGEMPDQNCREFSECLTALAPSGLPCGFIDASSFRLPNTRET